METLKPPYPSTGQADAILDILRRTSPKKVDSKFIAENKIATAANAASVVNFVKFLGIADSDSVVKEEIANKLRLVGDERERFIGGLIKDSYKEILEGVNLQLATRDDLTNFFIHNYRYGPSPAKRASILLLHLCEKYGIPVSEDLKKKNYVINPLIKKTERKSLKAKNGQSSIPQNNLNKQIKGDIPEEGLVVLSILGNGLDRELRATSADQLQEFYDGKFKSFIDAAKSLFPEKSVIEDSKDEEQLEEE